MNGVDIATLIAIILSEILAFFMFLWYLTYYRLKHLHEISSRLPKASLLAGIFCICGVSFTHPFVLLFLNTSFIKYIPYSYTFCVFAVMVTTLGPYHIFTVRAYLIYFDMKWNKAMEDQQWRLYIDPQETNWFLKHKNLWGNNKRLSTIACIHWLFWTIFIIIITIYNNDKPNVQTRGILLLATLPPTIIDCTLYFKFPKFKDIWHIHKEIKLLLQVEIIAIIIYYIIAIVLNATFPSYEYIALQMLPILIGFIFTMIIYLWVFKQFHLPSNPIYISKYLQMNYLNYELSFSPTLTTTYSKGNQNMHKDELHSLGLQQILSDKHGFNEFARHLTKEFCLENLLFIVETQQWLQSLAKNENYLYIVNDSINNKKKGSLTLKLEFPDSAPKSRILQNNSDINNTHNIENKENENKMDLPSFSEYLQCVELFNKYIRNSAYFSVNISSRTRDELYEIFGFNDSSVRPDIYQMTRILNDNKMSKEKLFNLFEAPRKQIFQLLMYTYSRFKQTDEFIQLNEKI
eukprot:554879_1